LPSPFCLPFFLFPFFLLLVGFVPCLPSPFFLPLLLFPFFAVLTVGFGRLNECCTACYHAQDDLFVRAQSFTPLVLAAATEIGKSNAAKTDESQNKNTENFLEKAQVIPSHLIWRYG
jgi:hypothetical protein